MILASECSDRLVAREPEDLGWLFLECGDVGDVDGVVALYEPEAVLASPPGELATGHAIIHEVYQELFASGPQFSGEVPPYDAEALLNRCVERAALVAPVCSSGDPDEAIEARVRGSHHGQELLDLLGVSDQFGLGVDVVASQVEPHRLAVSEVLGPAAPAGGEEQSAVGDVADWLAVVPTGVVAGVVDQHQARRHWGREGEPEDKAHRHVERGHELGLALTFGWAGR